MAENKHVYRDYLFRELNSSSLYNTLLWNDAIDSDVYKDFLRSFYGEVVNASLAGIECITYDKYNYPKEDTLEYDKFKKEVKSYEQFIKDTIKQCIGISEDSFRRGSGYSWYVSVLVDDIGNGWLKLFDIYPKVTIKTLNYLYHFHKTEKRRICNRFLDYAYECNIVENNRIDGDFRHYLGTGLRIMEVYDIDDAHNVIFETERGINSCGVYYRMKEIFRKTYEINKAIESLNNKNNQEDL